MSLLSSQVHHCETICPGSYLPSELSSKHGGSQPLYFCSSICLSPPSRPARYSLLMICRQGGSVHISIKAFLLCMCYLFDLGLVFRLFGLKNCLLNDNYFYSFVSLCHLLASPYLLLFFNLYKVCNSPACIKFIIVWLDPTLHCKC